MKTEPQSNVALKEAVPPNPQIPPEPTYAIEFESTVLFVVVAVVVVVDVNVRKLTFIVHTVLPETWTAMLTAGLALCVTFTVHDVAPFGETIWKLNVPAVVTIAVATGTGPEVTMQPPPKVMSDGPLTAIVAEAGTVVVAVITDVGQLTARDPAVSFALDDVALTFVPGGAKNAALALPVNAAIPTMAATSESAILDIDVIRYAFQEGTYTYIFDTLTASIHLLQAARCRASIRRSHFDRWPPR